MPLQYRKTIVVSAASTTAVAASQTPGAAGNLSLTSATVTLPNGGQRPEIVSTSDISNRTFTFTGTDRIGNPMTATLTGPNNATVILPFTMATITNIAISGAAAGALTVGYAAQADLAPLPLDIYPSPTNVSLTCEIVSGSPTYTVYFTQDNVQDATLNPGSYVWIAHATLVSQTATATGNFSAPVVATSLFVSGASTMTFIVLQGPGKF